MLRIFALVVLGWLVPTDLVAEVVPFGNFNVDYRTKDNNGEESSRFNDQGSRFGVRWAEYLDDRFEARYIIEAESALAAENDLVGELRQAWFGIRGDFGEIRVGRHLSPTRVALDPIDLFADQAADQNTVLESEVRHDKSIAYINRFNGVGYAVALSVDDDNRISQDLLVNYKTKQFYLAAAYLHGSDQFDSLRLGASYRFPQGHHLGVAIEHLNDADGDAGHIAHLFSAGYQFGDVLLKGQVGRNKPDTGGSAETLFGFGVDYEWLPNTVLQAQYSINKHRDHSVSDRERVLSLGASVKF